MGRFHSAMEGQSHQGENASKISPCATRQSRSSVPAGGDSRTSSPHGPGGAYVPSLEQIREACEAIRLEWDEELRRRPSTVKHWRPPGMTTADVEGAAGRRLTQRRFKWIMRASSRTTIRNQAPQGALAAPRSAGH